MACSTCYTVFTFKNDHFSSEWRLIDCTRDKIFPHWLHTVTELDRAGENASANGILYAVLRHLEKQEDKLHSHSMHPVLLKAIEYIELHKNEFFTIDDISRFSGGSKSLLNKLFRAEFGYSAGKYILQKKKWNWPASCFLTTAVTQSAKSRNYAATPIRDISADVSGNFTVVPHENSE